MLEWKKNTEDGAEYGSHIAIVKDTVGSIRVEVFSDRDEMEWAYFIEDGEDEDSRYGFKSKEEAMREAEVAARNFIDDGKA